MNGRSLSFVILSLAAVAPARAEDSLGCLVRAARSQVGVTVRYDGSYARLAYPGGDVPVERGVCTDVVVRAYRSLGVDLQQELHEDMKSAWRHYPKNWGLQRPDSNIDHRRVPNLATFFTRHGKRLAVSTDPAAYAPGDLVTWTVPPHLPHVGIISDRETLTGVPLVLHNIGQGATEEDVLFEFPITGHYRYAPERVLEACTGKRAGAAGGR